MTSGFSVARMPLAAAAQSDGLALGLIFDQAGGVLGLADHAHVGLLDIGVLEAIGEPVGHAVAHHHHIALGHAFALLRRRRLGEILIDALGRLRLEGREEIAAEPSAAAAAAPPRRGRQPPKLKNCA